MIYRNHSEESFNFIVSLYFDFVVIYKRKYKFTVAKVVRL